MIQNRTRHEISEHYGVLMTCARRCDDVSFAHFLQQSKGLPRFYWESGEQQIAFAGKGHALEIVAHGQNRFSRIEQQVKDIFSTIEVLNEDAHSLALPRIFGGFAFSEDSLSDYAWADFESALFVLPHYQLVSLDGEKWLTINVHVPESEIDQDIRTEIDLALQQSLETLNDAQNVDTELTTPAVEQIRFPMSYNQWESNIHSLTNRMKAGELEKVVLARLSELNFAGNINPENALHYLARQYRECFRFLFEPHPNHAFLGATPELLASVSGNQVQTMALAGSIKRGKTPTEDDHFADMLLRDPKERHEHQLVIDRIEATLRQITTTLDVGETGLYKLQNIQHLHTPIRGALSHTMGILRVIERLHPTPALGGIPYGKAMQVIDACEPFPRGWYASPIGWIDYQLDGQFAVAIRSAVCQNNRAWLYAGAGIVAGSQPEKEWNETYLKFRPMQEALGVEIE